MTELCLGTVQFGMDYGIQGNGQPDVSKAVEIINTAYGSAESVLNIFIS